MTKTQKKKKLKALGAKMDKQWKRYKVAQKRASDLYKAYRKTWSAHIDLDLSL
jgi:hypothetical protein